MSGTSIAPAIPVVGSAGKPAYYDPNRPTPNILNPGERVGGDAAADNQAYNAEDAYIPLSLAELRIQSLMTDLKNMKEDHLTRLEKLRDNYEQLLRSRHQDAKAKIDEARKLLLDQMAEIAKLTNEKKMRDQFMEGRSKEYEAQLKDSRAELEKARVGLDVSQKQLRDKENLVKQREEDLEKKIQQCKAIEDQLSKVQAERDNLLEQKNQLERRLAATDGGRPIAAGGASSDSLFEAQSKVIQLEKELAILNGEKKLLADEVESLRKAGPVVAADNGEQRQMFQATLDELTKSNAAMIDAHKEQTAKLISDAHRDRDEALAKQRDFYDKMIEQMVRLGEEEEKAKERAKAASLNLSDLEDARRVAKEAEDTRAAITNERRALDTKLTHCVDRLEEVEAAIRRNNDVLTGEVDPKLNALEQQVNALRAEADEASRDRERASQYTLEDAVAEFNKIGFPFDQVTPQVVTTMMQACGQGELTAAQKAAMREKKEEHDKIKEYVDQNPDDEAARTQLTKLRAEFKSIKEQAQKSIADARSAMYSLKLDPQLIEDDEFRATVSRACEMWREVALRAAPKAAPPQDLVEGLARFNLAPELMTPEKLAELRPFLALFPDFNTAIRDHKAQKERRDEMRALVDGELAAKLEAAREAMSIANATGENVAEATAQLDEATAQMAQAQQEAEQLEASVHALVQTQKEMLERVQSEAARLGIANEEMKFRGVKNGKELQAVVDAWDEYQAKLADDPGPIQRHDADLPSGPSAELLAELEALRQRQNAIKNDLAKLDKERKELQQEDENYRGKQRLLDMEATNADRSWREARKRLQAAQNAAAVASGESVELTQPENEADEQDLTNGVAIKLSADIAVANQQLIRLADELESLKAKLRAAWQERDRLIEELNTTKTRHSQELAKAQAAASHYQNELNLKMQEYKTTAGTHYAKFGIGGVNYQTKYAEQLSKISQESDPHAAYQQLIFELEKSRDEAAERANNLQRKLEAGGVSAAAAAAATGATLEAGQTAVSNAELDALRRDLAEARSSKADVERTLEGVRAQLKTLQESTAGSQGEIQAKLVTITGEAAEAKARAEKLREEKVQLERAQDQLNSVKAEIESQCSQLQSRVTDLEGSLSQSQAKCQEQEAEIARLQSELDSLQNQLADMKREHEAQVEALKAEHQAKLEAQASEFSGQISAIGAERDEAKAVLGAEVQAKEAAMAESQQRAETIVQLNTTIVDKDQMIADLRHKYLDEMERRKRFQQDYEGLKGSIRVYCRVRPFIRNELESPDENARIKCVAPGPNTWSCILKTQRQGLQGINVVEEEKSFDHVFLSDFGERYDNGSQAQVFTECSCFADMAFDGLNTCIFAYGQSGSGKTWTMRGDPGKRDLWGLKPRMIYHMYELKEAGKMAYNAKISCSMYEIYNDQIYDILDRYEKVVKWQNSKGSTIRCFKCLESGHSYIDCKNCAKCHQPGHTFSVCSAKQKGQLYIDRFSLLDAAEMKEEEKKGGKNQNGNQSKTLTAKILGEKVKIEGLEQKYFDSAEDMFDYVDKAEILRRVRATGLNDESSRSHLVFTIYVERESLKPKANQPRFTQGKLSLCDLAGSERADRVQMGPYVTPEDKAAMLEEGKAINKSLSALTAIFNTLGNPDNRKNGAKLDYRSTTLTTVMRDSVGGAARTLMFVNVSPSLINVEETKSTLGYGGIVKNITNLVATVDTGADELREELAALKAKLAQYEGGGDGQSGGP